MWLSMSGRARSFFLMFFLLHFCVVVSSQNILSISPGAEGGAKGGIRSTHQNVLALFGNQAGLASLQNASFYASAERRFNNEGLNFYGIAGAIPTRFGCLGVSIFYHGFSEYNEKLLGVTYARKLIENLSIGTRFDFIQASIPAYGNTSAATVEFGIQAKISQSVLLGFHIYNPFEIRWSDAETLPAIFSVGLAYTPTDKLWISGEVEKVSDFRENVKWGLQYLLLDELALRIGFNTTPALISFGFGYRLNSGLNCDIGSTVHQDLGFSPMAGIGYTVKKS